MALRGLFSCLHLNQIGWEKRRIEVEREGPKRERERKLWDFRERSSTFSLEFPAIGPSVSGDARSKVGPHGKDYAWVPVSRSFGKLWKGRNFSPTCFKLCLRVILMGGDLLRPEWVWFRFQNIGPSEEIPCVVLNSPRTVVWLV